MSLTPFPAKLLMKDVPNDPKAWFRGTCWNLLYRVRDWVLMTADWAFLFNFEAAWAFARSEGWRLPTVGEVFSGVPESFPGYVRRSKGLRSPGTEIAVWATGPDEEPTLVFWSEKNPQDPESVTHGADAEIHASVAVSFGIFP